MALEIEMKTYHKELPRSVAHLGKFVLIQGETVVDIYDTYQDALKAGYKTFGLEPFMVKQIQAVEQAQFITRNIAVPCLT